MDLPYRPDLPTIEQTRADRLHWLDEESAARQAGDLLRVRDCRAQVERMDRRLTRLATLPAGATLPLPLVLWQIGDAFWFAVASEHYNLLQRALRQRFPGVPLVVATLANGSPAWYLPTADAYGKGLYQDSVAVLAPGSLEQLIDAIGREIHTWLHGAES